MAHFVRSPVQTWYRVITFGVCVSCIAAFAAVLFPTRVAHSQKGESSRPPSLLAQQTSTPTLQRRTNQTAGPNTREIECQRQHNQWDKSLPSRSLMTGGLFYFVLISIFTVIGFSTSFVRALCAFVIAAASSPIVIGLQKREAFKVCPEPTNIYGLLTADLFMWTLLGVLTTGAILVIIRQFSAVRKLNEQQPS